MRPFLGVHLVIYPYAEPVGQNDQPAGAQLDGVTHAGGAATGTERTRGAIAPLVVSASRGRVASRLCFVLLGSLDHFAQFAQGDDRPAHALSVFQIQVWGDFCYVPD